MYLLRKRIKTVSLLSVGEGHPHARGERGVKNHSRALVSGCKVYRGHRTNALSIQNNVLWADAISVRERENWKLIEVSYCWEFTPRVWIVNRNCWWQFFRILITPSVKKNLNTFCTVDHRDSILVTYRERRACHAASMSAYRFFSDGFPVLTP